MPQSKGGTPKNRALSVPSDAPATTDSLVDKSNLSTGVPKGTGPLSTDPSSTANGYTLSGDRDTDLDAIASHYRPSDLDDNTWRGMWKTVFSGESSNNLEEGESKYGKLPKGQRAVGGMQVLPKTGRGLGFTDEELKDPIYRFMAGVKNLRTEYDEIGKDKRVQGSQHRIALTFAAYHAGRKNVLKSLDAGEDGVPDVDDGKVNTRDYTKDKLDNLQRILAQSGAFESADPALLTDEEAAQKFPLTSDEQTFDLSKPSETDIKSQDKTPIGKGVLDDPAMKALMDMSPLQRGMAIIDKMGVDPAMVALDDSIRGKLGVVTPATHPHKINRTIPVTFELPKDANGKPSLTADAVRDAVTIGLTGDTGLPELFRRATGENPGEFLDSDQANKWLQRQLESGALRINEVDGRFIAEGQVPVQNWVVNRINALSQGGVEGYTAETARMRQEIADNERLVAEEEYSKAISEAKANKDDARAAELEAELEAKYPTTASEEMSRAIRAGTARGLSELLRTGMNIEQIVEAPVADAITDDAGKQAYVSSKAREAKQARLLKASLEAKTPSARRWYARMAEAAVKEVVYSPVYVMGGAVIGPAGLIYTTAIRDADKPMDQFISSIASSIVELPFGVGFKGLIAGKDVGTLLGKSGAMASGGVGEFAGDVLVDLAKGEKINWENALGSLVIGAAFELGEGSHQGTKEGGTQVSEPRVFPTELRSFIGVTQGEDGKIRFQGVLKQGENVGLIELNPQHPMVMKYALQAQQGGIPFVSMKVDEFDQALNDFKGVGKVQLPKMSAEQMAAYLRGEDTVRVEKGKLTTAGAKTDEAKEEQGIVGQDEPVQASVGRAGESQEAQGVKEKEGVTSILTPDEQKQAEREASLSPSESAQLETVYDKLETTDEKIIRGLLRQADRRFVKKIQGTPEQEYAQQAFEKISKLTTEEQQVLAKVIGANFAAPSKTPTTPGETSDYSASIQAMTDEEFEANPQLVANEREVGKFLEDAKSGKVFTATTAEEQAQAATSNQEFKKDQESVTQGEKKIKVGRVGITLPKGLAAQWEQADIQHEAAKKKVDTGKLSLDEKKKAIRVIDDNRKKERDRIVDEYRRLEAEQIQRGYLRDSDRPVAILSEEGDTLTIKVAGEDTTREVPRSAVETRKERGLKKTKKAKFPTGIKIAIGLGDFSETKQGSRVAEGVIYINDNARSAIEDALDVEVDRGFTVKGDKIPEIAKVLREKGLKRIATQLENASEGRAGAAIIPISDESAAETRYHEQIHTVAYDKRLPSDALRRLYRDGTAVRQLLEDLRTSKDKTIRTEFSDMGVLDFIQEVIAYGATGDHASLGVSPDVLYDALVEVMSEYNNAFPNEELEVIADNALINFDAIMKEASRRDINAETKGKKQTGRSTEADKEGRQVGSEKVPERQRDILRTGQSRTDQFIEGIRNLQTSSQGPVLITDLRDEFPELRLEKFHQVLNGMVDRGDVYVHRQDDAKGLSEKDREKMLKIGDEYYSAVTIPGESILRKVDKRNENKTKTTTRANPLVIETTSPQFRSRVEQPIDPFTDIARGIKAEDVPTPTLTTDADKSESKLQEIIRKDADEVTTSDAKKVITEGRFGVLAGLNKTKTQALKRELNSMGYKVYDTNNGVFVILNSNSDIANILRLGARYKNDRVLIGDSGSYRAPFTRNTPLGRLGNELYSKENIPKFDVPQGVRVQLPKGVVTFDVADVFKSKRRQDEAEKRQVSELTTLYKKSFKKRADATTVDLHDWLIENQDKITPKTNIETATFLEEATAEILGDFSTKKMNEDEANAIRSRRAVRDGLAIVRRALSGRGDRQGDVDSGLSWYAASIKKMHDITGIAFPEILSQPQLRALFDLTLAMSSQGNKVKENYRYAVNLWRRVIEEFQLGRDGTEKVFPTKLATPTVYKTKTSEISRDNYGRFGPQLEKFNFLTQGYVPVGSYEQKQLKKQGVEMRKTEEFEDINGAQQWYKKDPELEGLIEKYGRIGGVFEYLLLPGSTEVDPRKATEVLGPKIGAFFLNIAGFSQLVTVDMWASRWFYRVNGGLVNPLQQKGIQEAPKNGTDGDIIRGVMQGIANEYNKRHVNKIAPADVQAILWYAEKDIWKLSGSEDSGTIDFAQAAEQQITEELVADISGAAQTRSKVIDEFQAASPMGDKIDTMGTDAAKKANENFFVREMALPARIGLSATTRKQVINRKLLTYDAKEWRRHAEWAKGEPLDMNQVNDLYSLLQAGFRATTKDEHDKSIDDLQNFVDEVSSMNIFEFLLTARRAGMLSGVKTTGRNIVSNFAHLVAEELKRGGAVPVDVALGIMSTTKDRTVQGISARGIYNGIKNLPAGFKAFKDTIVKGNTGATYETFNLGYDPHVMPSWMTGGRAGARFLNATVGNFAKYIFRFQAAQDAIFRTYAYNRAMYEVGWLEQKNGGRKVADVLANPTVAQSDMAWRAAEFAVFQNDNFINTGYQRWKGNRSEIIKYVLDYQLPFIKTGSNIFLQTMDYLVIGSAVKATTALSKETLKDIGKGDWNKLKQKMWTAIDDADTRAAIAESFGRGLVGIGLAIIGYKLAAAGMLYGFGDEDEKERQRRIAQGAGAGHMKIGNRWVDIRAISPIGTLVLAGASAYRAQSKELTGENTRADAFIRLFSTMVSEGLPMARAADEFLNPKQAQSYAKRLIGAGSLVPAFVAEIAAIQDDVQRDQKGDGLKESVKNEVKSRLPKTPLNTNFNRQSLPPKTDVFGRELQQPFGMDPFATKKDTTNAVTQEASAVGWSMTPPKRDTKKGETQAAFQERKTKTQNLIDRVFTELVNDSEYPAKADKTERKEILDDSAALARRAVKTGEKVSAAELQDIVELVLDKWKARAEIQKDSRLDKEQKDKYKKRISSKYSRYIKGATADDDNN